MNLLKPSSVSALLTRANKARILAAIRKAEARTSGEIRLHVESRLKGESPLVRAEQRFFELNMQATQLRNGALIYLALDDRRFAIFGDKGIHAKVGDDFWQAERDAMQVRFHQDDIIGGIEHGIAAVGAKLRAYFPVDDDNPNQLSDEISHAE